MGLQNIPHRHLFAYFRVTGIIQFIPARLLAFQDLLLLSYAWLGYSVMHAECSFSACVA